MPDNDALAALRLITLGGAQLRDAVGRDVAPGQRKLLALLAYLALEAPRPASRETLATLLWGERPDEQARGSLRQALFQLKRVAGDVLEVMPESVRLKPDTVDVDAAALQEDVERGNYREAALRWNGEFLAGADDVGGESYRAWLESERARTRRLVTRALGALTSEAAARGAWAEAASWAERWTHVQPLEEGPVRRLVEGLSLAGRGAEALARHAGFVARRRAELGTGPSDEFLRLGAQLERRARAATNGPPGSAAILPPELVGRGEAFATLTAAWRDARRTRRPVVVVVEGDAGAGRTRLADEFLRGIEGARGDAVVLRARARAAERDSPFSAARELLSPLADAPGLLGAPPTALSEVAALVPAIAEQIGALPAASTRGHALADAVARVVVDVADEAPIAVLVDDLAEIDAESQRLLLSLLRRVESGAVLWIVTARPGEAGSVAELRDVTGTRRVTLAPLSLADIEALLASMTRLAPEDRRLLAERIAAEVGSYPYDVVQTTTLLLDRGDLAPDAAGVWRFAAGSPGARLPIAPTVRDAVRRRLATLGDRSRATLEIAAVVGRTVSVALLADAAGVEPDDVADALDELTARGFLRPSSIASGQEKSVGPVFELTSEAVRRVAGDRVSDERRSAVRAMAARRGLRDLTGEERTARALDTLETRYAIGTAVSEGKLTSTFLARDRLSKRDVLLHTVRGGALTGAGHFLATLERIAAFTHPNVIPIVDFGTTPGALYYATVRADAPSVRERLARERPLAVDEALGIATDVARALAAAHGCGIHHGDLRPKHITAGLDRAAVAGLGIVQALAAQDAGGGPEGTGVTIGAPAYLSPEQLSGEGPADGRSDIYSWACVLYEMLVGEPPFAGSSRSVIAGKLTQAPPSARARRESLPKQLDRLLRACLARVPADRCATMAEVIEALDAAG